MGRAPRVPRPRRGPGRGPLPDLARRAVPAARSRRPRRPGEAVPRHRPRRPRARRARSTSTPASRRSSASPAASWSGPRRGAIGPRRRRSSSRHRPTRAGSGACRRCSCPVYDYVLVSDPLDARRAGVDRLGAPPGPVRLEQPVPLLPADRRRPDPVGRLRRHPPLRQQGRPRARPPAGDVREARGAVLPGVPAARGPALPVPLGRRDRHDVAVHRHLRADDGRAA